MLEFWDIYGGAVLLFVNLGVILVVWVVLRRFQRQVAPSLTRRISETVIERIEPLLRDAESTAAVFDAQIREKKALIASLNQTLESRLDEVSKILHPPQKKERASATPGTGPVATATGNDGENQGTILELYSDGMDVDSIAEALNIPRGEVKLVIDMKKKFIALMNKTMDETAEKKIGSPSGTPR